MTLAQLRWWKVAALEVTALVGIASGGASAQELYGSEGEGRS